MSLTPCFIHLIGALWDRLIIGPLAIIFPGIQNAMMLHHTSHAQSMDLNIDMNFSMKFYIHTFGGVVF